MKKLLLSAAFICVATISANAQQISSDNFDSYTVGNVASDLTGATAGASGWKIYTAQNGNASNFQFVAEPSKGNVLSIVSPNAPTVQGNDNAGYVFKDFPANAWTGRTSGNNILRVEYEFYTGGATSSKSAQGCFAYSANSQGQLLTLGGFQYQPETRMLLGAGRTATGALGVAKLGTSNTDLILPANTWVKVYYQLNYTNNTINFQVPSLGVNLTASLTLTNLPPVEVDFVASGLTGNTSSSTVKYDNYVVSAVNTITLGVNDIVSTKFNVYPNPATDVVTITNTESIGIDKITVTDINGRIVKTNNYNQQAEIQLNVSDLNAGVYILNVSTKEGTATKKFIKK